MKTSLAQFVSETREKMGLSQTGLAKKSSLPIKTIEDIEAGQELFLASTIRQKLAKGLKLNNRDIKIFEKQFDDDIPGELTLEELKNEITQGATTLKCPQCSNELICHIEKMFDLKDNLILHPKARCSKCPFQVK